MVFLRVAGIAEILPGKMKMIILGGKEILLANVNGSFFAMAGRCTHAKGDLSQGTLEGSVVTCPRHGSQFDVTTGKNLRGAKISFLKIAAGDEPSYKVKIEGNDILVDVG